MFHISKTQCFYSKGKGWGSRKEQWAQSNTEIQQNRCYLLKSKAGILAHCRQRWDIQALDGPIILAALLVASNVVTQSSWLCILHVVFLLVLRVADRSAFLRSFPLFSSLGSTKWSLGGSQASQICLFALALVGR